MELVAVQCRRIAGQQRWSAGQPPRPVARGGAAQVAVGKFELQLGTAALRTLAFSALVFGSQATIYAIRERKHLWNSRPSVWVVASSIADILIACVLAIGGFAMTALPALVVIGALASAVIFAFLLDMVKVPVFIRLKIA